MDAPTVMDNINVAGFSTPTLPNEGWKVWLALVIMITFSGLFVVARISIRISSRQMGADDYTIIAAMISCLIQTTFWGLAIRAGYGADYLLLDTYHRQLFNKYWFLGATFYPITIGLFKTSVILLNKRIFVQRGFQIACWITLLVNTCWAVGNYFGFLFECTPVPAMWGAITVGTKVTCFDLQGLWISLTIWDVSSDAWILAMSVPMIWRLHLNAKDKIMVTGVFFLGAVVIVFSVLSCSAVVSSLKVEGSQSNQYTFALANLFQVLESNMGIIGACLPVMRQTLKRHCGFMLGSTKGSKMGRRYSYDPSKGSFPDRYAMQHVSNKQKGSGDSSWHNVSISRPEIFRSAQRKSDELGIISDTVETGDMDSGSSRSHTGNGIRKDFIVSVDRR